jgi:hypothetical protein
MLLATVVGWQKLITVPSGSELGRIGGRGEKCAGAKAEAMSSCGLENL